MHPFATGTNFNVTSWGTGDQAGNNEIHVVGSQPQQSWVYFNGTFEYPFAIQFEEKRRPLDSGKLFSIGWHYLANYLDQFLTKVYFRPSLMVYSFRPNAALYGSDQTVTGSFELILPPSLQYGTMNFKGPVSAYGNWTDLSWTQNCTHVMVAVMGNIDPIFSLPYALSYLLIYGLDMNGAVVNSFKTTRVLDQNGYVNENEGFQNSADVFVQGNLHVSGLEIAVAKSLFVSNNVVTLRLYISAIGWVTNAFVFVPPFVVEIDVVPCPNIIVNQTMHWIEDGNPADFDTAFSEVHTAMSALSHRHWTVIVDQSQSAVYMGDKHLITLSAPLLTMSNPSSATPL